MESSGRHTAYGWCPVTWIAYDEALIEGIALRMDLRAPNKAAVRAVIEEIAADNSAEAADGLLEVVCDLATGVGKTYIMAALIDYLAAQGVRDILIVTPGKTIQNKTVANFTPNNRKQVPGMDAVPHLVTPESIRTGRTADALGNPEALKLFVFNVQQLTSLPSRGSHPDEFTGINLHSYLRHAENLVIVADEHHVYHSQARQFYAAVRDLKPRALIGLTATPDPADKAKIVFGYSLGDAIADKLVKVPVIVYRQDGHRYIRTQLADACHLLSIKAAAYAAQDAREPVGRAGPVHPVLFVVCRSVQEADRAAALLRGTDLIGDPAAVLVITSQSEDEALAELAAVEEPDSPVRAVVSVNKLKEGWDVKNIAVIVADRTLASQTLTMQILGRGLRLPYGTRTGTASIDQVDIIAHDSYKKLMGDKDILIQRIMPSRRRAASATLAADDEQDESVADTDFPVTGEVREGNLRLRIVPSSDDGDSSEGATALEIQDFETVAERARQDSQHAVLQRVTGVPSITFPCRQRKVIVVQFSLSNVTDAEARAAGAAFVSEIHVPLVRKALNVQRTADGGMRVDMETLPPETATQTWLPPAQVRRHLQNRILKFEEVTQDRKEVNAAQRITEAFLVGANVNDNQEVDWSAARSRQAAEGLHALVKRNIEARRPPPQYEVRRVPIPSESRPMPADVIDMHGPYEKNRWYGGWAKSVLPAARFDAETTEFALAQIMDHNAAVRWWLRLEKEDQAFIELDGGSRYYPDFIALDHDDVSWIIEGKRDRDAETPATKAKKTSAESHLLNVSDSGAYGTWRYLFCTETAIRRSRGSWDALVAAAGGLL